MKTLIIKTKGILSKEMKDKISENVLSSLDKGVLVLDESCDCEVVDLERK